MEAIVSKDIQFSLSHKAAMAAFLGLSVAFEVVLEGAVFPDRVDSNGGGPSSRLADISSKPLRRMKNLSTQGISEVDDAAGIAAAISVVEEVAGRLRETM
jgi:hypothetical protein